MFYLNDEVLERILSMALEFDSTKRWVNVTSFGPVFGGSLEATILNDGVLKFELNGDVKYLNKNSLINGIKKAINDALIDIPDIPDDYLFIHATDALDAYKILQCALLFEE